MSDPVFTGWQPKHGDEWGKRPLCIEHRLHKHNLFDIDSLAELIERYPRGHYSLVHMGARGDKRYWREGRVGKLSGREVIECIGAGRMWLNLRRVNEVDRRYGQLLDQIFDEVRGRVPGYETFARTSGILISSPNAQVYYHSDLPGQSLWQLHGRKRVYLYPARKPFITDEQLEKIALYEVEVDMPYRPEFDAHAVVFELQAGQMLHWPLNAPHRVENLDVLNVSMTTEYWTDAIRRNHMVTMANAIMRHKLGLRPGSRTTNGPSFWTKAALQAGMRQLGLLESGRKSRRPISFELDRFRPGEVLDLPVGPG